MCWPHKAVGAQRVKRAHNVNKIPATVSATVFTSIGVVEISPEAVTRNFIVESERVVANTAGAWLG